MIDWLCERWHCLPSALLEEPADLVLGTFAILAAAAPETDEDGGEPAQARPPSAAMEAELANLSRVLTNDGE